jgi:phenylpropionate dioxygenase-like ring-hydroxylating dioxygenase large terminal subunit
MKRQDRLACRYVRDMMMSWEVTLENVMDPAHVAFAHHGVQGDRSKPAILSYDQTEWRGPQGFDVIMSAGGGMFDIAFGPSPAMLTLNLHPPGAAILPAFPACEFCA